MRTIEAWDKEEWNNPNLSDYYLMQIAQAIVAQNSKRQHKLDDFKIRFGASNRKTLTPAEKEQMIAAAKARWRSRMNKGK